MQAFDGTKKSCREQLVKHNLARKQERADRKQAKRFERIFSETSQLTSCLDNEAARSILAQAVLWQQQQQQQVVGGAQPAPSSGGYKSKSGPRGPASGDQVCHGEWRVLRWGGWGVYFDCRPPGLMLPCCWLAGSSHAGEWNLRKAWVAAGARGPGQTHFQVLRWSFAVRQAQRECTSQRMLHNSLFFLSRILPSHISNMPWRGRPSGGCLGPSVRGLCLIAIIIVGSGSDPL